MQEDIENRTVTLMVSSSKFTGRTMLAAISKFLAHMKNRSPPTQKQEVVLVINPNAPNKETAEAFIAMLTSMEYGVMRDYVLHADAIEPYNQRPYTITGEMIEQWQGATSAIWISTNDPLQSDAFTAQARTLIERYAAGQLNDHMFLIKLNETASMVESEVR